MLAAMGDKSFWPKTSGAAAKRRRGRLTSALLIALLVLAGALLGRAIDRGQVRCD